MSRIHPECLDSDPFEALVAAAFLLRQEPDDEEEDEGDGEEDEDRVTTTTTTATRSDHPPAVHFFARAWVRGVEIRPAGKDSEDDLVCGPDHDHLFSSTKTIEHEVVVSNDICRG